MLLSKSVGFPRSGEAVPKDGDVDKSKVVFQSPALQTDYRPALMYSPVCQGRMKLYYQQTRRDRPSSPSRP